MEQWKKDFDKNFTDRAENRHSAVFAIRGRSFIKRLLKKERERDKLHEILTYVQESKNKTEILIQYILNNTSPCFPRRPSSNLIWELGLGLTDRENLILFILEKYFKEHPKE